MRRPSCSAASRPVLRATCTALASTLYELLAGVPAFWVGEEETIAPLLKRIALDPPPDLRPRGVPAAVADVLELGLQKEPADRPDSVAAFGRRLQETQQACGQRDHEDVGDACGRAGRAAGGSRRIGAALPTRGAPATPSAASPAPRWAARTAELARPGDGAARVGDRPVRREARARVRCQSTGSGVCVIAWVSRSASRSLVGSRPESPRC